MAVKILCEAVRCKRNNTSIESLIEELKEAEESKEYRLYIKNDNFKEYGLSVLDDFKLFASTNNFEIVIPNYEGVRVAFKDEEASGWMLVRMSLHDPIIPINIETTNKGGVNAILKRILPFFTNYADLDIESLKKVL